MKCLIDWLMADVIIFRLSSVCPSVSIKCWSMSGCLPSPPTLYEALDWLIQWWLIIFRLSSACPSVSIKRWSMSDCPLSPPTLLWNIWLIDSGSSSGAAACAQVFPSSAGACPTAPPHPLLYSRRCGANTSSHREVGCCYDTHIFSNLSSKDFSCLKKHREK